MIFATHRDIHSINKWRVDWRPSSISFASQHEKTARLTSGPGARFRPRLSLGVSSSRLARRRLSSGVIKGSAGFARLHSGAQKECPAYAVRQEKRQDKGAGVTAASRAPAFGDQIARDGDCCDTAKTTAAKSRVKPAAQAVSVKPATKSAAKVEGCSARQARRHDTAAKITRQDELRHSQPRREPRRTRQSVTQDRQVDGQVRDAMRNRREGEDGRRRRQLRRQRRHASRRRKSSGEIDSRTPAAAKTPGGASISKGAESSSTDAKTQRSQPQGQPQSRSKSHAGPEKAAARREPPDERQPRPAPPSRGAEDRVAKRPPQSPSQFGRRSGQAVDGCFQDRRPCGGVRRPSRRARNRRARRQAPPFPAPSAAAAASVAVGKISPTTTAGEDKRIGKKNRAPRCGGHARRAPRRRNRAKPVGQGRACARPRRSPPAQKHGFKLNEFIVYPAHGVGRSSAWRFRRSRASALSCSS